MDRAAALAAEWRARLIVLHVLEQPAPASDLPSWRRPLDPHEASRRRVLRDLRGSGGLDLEVLVERGEPAPRILDVAERLGCELIVTGVARDEALGRLFLGTTVEALVRRTSVPVLVVESRPGGAYRNVVVATDFSEGSRAALEAALALLPAARVRLFHAYRVRMESLVSDTTAAREAAARLAMEESRAFLAATPAAAASGRLIETVCEYGEVGALLEEFVQLGDVDLVVLGTEGRTGLAGVLLGSVAQRLLNRLPVDTLVARRRRG
jgi:nucleotide-binding universal stress UspA family protein